MRTSAGSHSNHSFAQVPRADIPRSSFNRSHGYKTTFDAGYLIPVYVDEALPGDTFNLRATMFGRLATPKVPVLDNMFMDVFFFAVPNRLVWDNWQKFCGERTNPADITQSTEYLVPEVVSPPEGFPVQGIADYMGVPPGVPCRVSALFYRAYNLIWNEWFRDQNLQDSIPVVTGDGPDTPIYGLQRRGKRHDYFTSALPWPQKGPGVEIPLGTSAPVVGVPSGGIPKFVTASDYGAGPAALAVPAGGATDINVSLRGVSGSYADELVWSQTGLVADLSTATAATINSLRQAFQIQKLYERDARGGTRYVEILKSHFGVTSPDARLQRPEFLGGATIPININPVTQTSATGVTGGTTPQGNLSAFGTFGGHAGFTKSFVEHCVVIGLVSVRADLTYQQGIPRMAFRRTRWDFYWPALSHLGEQAVLQKEIYATGDPTNDDKVWGYQERWAEYRYYPSQITGKFRSNNTTPAESLDVWHLGLNFESPPALNGTFIEEHPPVERIVAVTSEPQFLFDSHWAIKAVRPMPTYSTPGFIDHF